MAEGPGGRAIRAAAAALSLAVPLLALVWVLSLPRRAGLLVFPEQVAALMLGAAIAVVYLRAAARHGGALRAANLALAAGAGALGLWVALRFPVLGEGAHRHPGEALLLGIAVTLLTMEALRRVVGLTLVILFAALCLYALRGDLVPGALAGRPIPAADILRFLGADSSATWGQPLQIAAFVVVVFVLFGRLLMAVGGGEFFTQISLRLAGEGPGNTAKVAVAASALFGTVSGSAVSNVMSTGVFTIPLMKRAGFRPAQAGAIEAVASTGGQIMPPVMGAAAFLMAEILQIPYTAVIAAALLPALFYFLSVWVQIDLMARRDRLPGGAVEGRRPMRRVLRAGLLTVASLSVLLGGMFGFGLGPELAAVWATGAAALLGLAAARFGPRALLAELVAAGENSADILLVTAAAGMIIGLLSTTGLGFALSFALLDVGSANLPLLLLLTALVGLVLGLGLPTTGVYLLLATLAAPPLVQLGVPPVAAHLFVLYYGMLSMITPPVALAAFAGASLAGAGQLATGWQALRFGWIAYFLPFLFVWEPGLLMDGSLADTLRAVVETGVCLCLFSFAMVGHARGSLGPAVRAGALAGALAAVAPLGNAVAEAAGLLAGFAALGALWLRRPGG